MAAAYGAGQTIIADSESEIIVPVSRPKHSESETEQHSAYRSRSGLTAMLYLMIKGPAAARPDVVKQDDD